MDRGVGVGCLPALFTGFDGLFVSRRAAGLVVPVAAGARFVVGAGELCEKLVIDQLRC